MHQKHLWKEHVYSALLYSLSSILTNSGPKLLRCLTFYPGSWASLQSWAWTCASGPGSSWGVSPRLAGHGPTDSRHCLPTAVVMEMFSEQALPKCKQIHSHKQTHIVWHFMQAWSVWLKVRKPQQITFQSVFITSFHLKMFLCFWGCYLPSQKHSDTKIFLILGHISFSIF